MIRKQDSPQPLFYAAAEISRPAAGNFYLRLSAAVGDWEKLAAPFAPAFAAERGRPTDPTVYLKIFLVGYLENICYDTDLAERIGDSIALRQFLGYSLAEAPPDHSSISRNRGRIAGCCRIEEVLEGVVELCRAQGLVAGAETALDGTLIPTNASLSSLRSITTGQSVGEHLAAVREHNAGLAAGEPRQSSQISNAAFRSTTDPEARIARKRGTPAKLC